MDIILVTPVRLFADGLSACFCGRKDITVRAIVNGLEGLRQSLLTMRIDLVLIDVTPGVDLDDVRLLATEHPEVALVAVGLIEQRQHVIHCGRAGFAGYVTRDTSVDGLCRALTDAVAGRLDCPADISGSLLRALFRSDSPFPPRNLERSLTSRESEVLQLIGRGFSNKEIAHELAVSVATIKHHVHNVLEKLHLSRRSQAMRQVREAPWLAVGPLGPTSSHAERNSKASGT
jgi:two-component system nitrate/nitrite response regulator NarL